MTTSTTARLRIYAWVGLVAVASSLLLIKNIDFRVYWYAARAFVSGNGELYGPHSGLGFPMHFRYPPVTYLLLWPLSLLPLYWAGVLWLLGAWVAMTSAVALALGSYRLIVTRNALLLACGYFAVYAVLALRAGNVQPYLIAGVFIALLLAESRPRVAAALLALTITFKIWPLFFLPWFVPRTRRAVLLWLLPALAVLWSAPLLYWSRAEYGTLLAQWFHFEFGAFASASDLWYFPGQSLRGVILRYLTPPGAWAQGFPDVHVLSLPVSVVIGAWTAFGAVSYACVCVAVLRSTRERLWIWDGIAFALFTILEPFCAKSSMVSMLPAVLVASALYSWPGRGAPEPRNRTARVLFITASALSALCAVTQARPLLRLLLTLGVDFLAALSLLIALLLWAFSSVYRRPSSAALQHSLSLAPAPRPVAREECATTARNEHGDVTAESTKSAAANARGGVRRASQPSRDTPPRHGLERK